MESLWHFASRRNDARIQRTGNVQASEGTGYKVLWLNETHEGKTNRALLEDKNGNRLFYTLTAKKEKAETVKVAFIPELNSSDASMAAFKAAFKEFSVTMSKKKMGLAVEEKP